MPKRSRKQSEAGDVVFTLEKVAHPASRTTVGDVGAFFRVRARGSLVNERVEIPYSRAAAKRVDEETLRLFWWDRGRRSLVLVDPSGVDRERRVVWGRISQPGIYGAIGLPANPAMLKTMAIFATFTAEELRERSDLIPPICGLILCPNPTTGTGGPGGLCKVCLGLEVPELHFPEVQIIQREPWVVFEPIPPKRALPLWPTPNHDYRNTSQGQLNGPRSAPSLRWTFQTAGLVSPAVIGADGTIYTAARGNSGPSLIHAIDGTTGVPRWSVQLSTPGSPVKNPVLAIGPDGTIFVTAADGALCAVEPSGSLKWRLPGAWGDPMASPNGDVIAPLGVPWVSRSIVAVMPSGAVRWSTPLVGIGSRVGAPRQVLAVRDDGSVIVAGEEVRALAEADGAVLWAYSQTTPVNIQAPLVVAEDGRILVNETTAGIQVLSSAGARQTSFPWVSFEFAVADTGTTYLRPLLTNGLVAVDPTGATLWARYFLGPNPGPPAIGRDGTLYVSEHAAVGSTGPHLLRALDPLTGVDLWTAPATAANSRSWTYPIAIGLSGQLVITEWTNGRVVAFS